MRSVKYILLIAAVFFFGQATAQSGQQDPTSLTQEIDYHIDELGNARLELKMKMNAQQWQAFKASPVANNPTIFKRDMERQMTAYLLEDIKTDLKENERVSVTSLVAKNMAVYKGKGRWEMKLGLKDPNVTKVSDDCYLMTGNTVSGGGLIHQIQKIFFPKGATDIKQDTDSFGNAIFTYNLEVEEGGINAFMLGGGGLILASAGLFFVRMRKK